MDFQNLIQNLQSFWVKNNCIILQPYDTFMGAGTLHPATAFSACKQKPWNVCYVQPCRRPADGRFSTHPNRCQHYYQFQVILNPVPDDFLELYLKSLNILNISSKTNDLNVIEDDWKSPTLGAFGLGWEVVCNGLEISQITYMKQIAGIECKPHIGEITYGLERLAMILQKVDRISNIIWSSNPKISYGQIFAQFEEEFSSFNFEHANIEMLKDNFDLYEKECKRLSGQKMHNAAYDYCLLAIHMFNTLDARGTLSAQFLV